jgi:molecular chaperone GrpE
MQPRVFVPTRHFSDSSSSWTDFFKGKKPETKAEEAKAEEPKVDEVKPEEAAAEPAAEAPKEEAPVADAEEEVLTPDVVSNEDLVKSAKAKMTEYIKEIDSLKATASRNDLAIKEYQNKVKELQAMVKREIDEQDNIRDRGRKDVADAKKFGVSSFCKNLLEGIDTLEMCLAAGQKTLAANPNTDLKNFIEGIVMSQQMFAKILASQQVVKYESMGEKADPNLHFVTAQLPDPEKEEGTIIHVIKEGYMIQERVLRPAQVCVVAPKM